MITVSDATKAKYKDGSYNRRLIITLPDLGYTFDDTEVYYESFNLKESILDGSNFEAVGCISSYMKVTVRDIGKELKGQYITVDISIDDEATTIPLFHGWIEEVTLKYNSKEREIQAYDYLYKLANIDCASWYKSLPSMFTIGSALESFISNVMGISCGSYSSEALETKVNRRFNPETLNALNVLKQFCQLIGCFGIIDRNGVFQFRELSGDREDVAFYRDFDYSEFSVNPIEKVSIRDTESGTMTTSGSGSNRYIIQGNMWLYEVGGTKKMQAASGVRQKLEGLSYHPYSASYNFYPWVEVGDTIRLEVYDFEASTSSGVDTYTTIDVIVFNRDVNGILSPVDTHSIEGEEEQREFVSAIGDSMTAIEEKMEELSRIAQTDVVVFRNTDTIHLTTSSETTIAELAYKANINDIILLQGNLKLHGSSTSLELRYYINDTEITTFGPDRFAMSGTYPIVAINNWWYSGKGLQDSSGEWGSNILRITAYNYGSTRDIDAGGARFWIEVKDGGLDDFDIEVTQEPDQTTFYVGEKVDYTGIIVSKVWTSDKTEDITDKCTFSPKDGKSYDKEQFITVKVNYSETNDVGETQDYETDFDIEITDVESSLRYLRYKLSGDTIKIYGFKENLIAKENPDIYITPTFIVKGKTYNTLLCDS